MDGMAGGAADDGRGTAGRQGAPRILLSAQALERHGTRIRALPGAEAFVPVLPPADAAGLADVDVDVAFLTRDVTGLSTKHEILPATGRYYDAMRRSPSLRWVHIHSAGADRPVFGELRARGVSLTTSSGANASVVAQTALAGMLALARHFPQLWAAQREARWAPLIGSGLPRDLTGQTVTIVGWGPIGQKLGAVLPLLGLNLVVVRQSGEPAGPGIETVRFDQLAAVLPRTDWLLLACPLNARTRGMIDAAALASLPPGARLVNVSRGEVIDEAALVVALQNGKLGGAYLDVYAHEPLPADSPIWYLPNVIATPHSAGFSDGNAARVADIFLDNLQRWLADKPLRFTVA